MIISGVICRKWFGTGNRCNFVDELRVKRRAAFPLPKLFSGLKCGMLKSFIRNYTTDIKND